MLGMSDQMTPVKWTMFVLGQDSGITLAFDNGSKEHELISCFT